MSSLSIQARGRTHDIAILVIIIVVVVVNDRDWRAVGCKILRNFLGLKFSRRAFGFFIIVRDDKVIERLDIFVVEFGKLLFSAPT
jgi:hypothetical protein